MNIDRRRLQQVLAGHDAQTLQLNGMREAAVLVALVVRDGVDHLLLTRRTDHLPHHQGEISFPGGGREARDADLLSVALRESQEELGITPADVTIFGQLDDVISIHDYRVTPFFGEIPAPYTYRVDHHEIARVLELPLADFFKPDLYRVEDWTWQGRKHPVRFYDVQGEEVWGMTAEIVFQLLRLLEPLRHR